MAAQGPTKEEVEAWFKEKVIPIYLFFNLFIAEAILSKEQRRLDFQKPPKPWHVGIHWIALAEYSHISTMYQGFSHLFKFFCIIFYRPNKPPA